MTLHDYEITEIDTTIRENLVNIYIRLRNRPEVKTILVMSRPHFENTTEIQLDHMILEAFDNLVPQQGPAQMGVDEHAEMKRRVMERMNKKVDERIKLREKPE